MSKEKCGLCDHDPACGSATIEGYGHGIVRLCHTDDHSCYERWEQERPPLMPYFEPQIITLSAVAHLTICPECKTPFECDGKLVPDPDFEVQAPEPRSVALELVETVYASDDPPYTAESELEALQESFDLERLCSLRNFLTAVMSAAREAQKAVDGAIASELGINAGVRYGDQFFRASGGRKFVITDPDAVVAFAGEDFPKLVNVPNSVRVGSLKALLNSRGADEKTIDTFGEWQEKDEILTVLPVDKAPKFVAKMEHGQRTIPKGISLESSE